MLPATKAIPKEMLPIVDKPIIQYIVEEAIDAGFEKVIFITHSSKSSLENHFNTSFDLETALEKRVKREQLNKIRDISKLKVKIHSVKQDEPKGLGHAILCAKSIIGKDSFGVMLPDMILQEHSSNNSLYKMRADFKKYNLSSLLLAKTKKSELNKYGVAKLSNNKTYKNIESIEDIIEKPDINQAPSNFFAVGRYIFTNNFMDYLSKEKPDKTGEIQLTGAISNFIFDGNITLAYKFDGNFFDCGEKIGYMKAIVEYGKKDRSIGKEFSKYLKK